MVEPPLQLERNNTDNSLVLFGMIASYLLAFVSMIIMIRMMVNCLYDRLMHCPPNLDIVIGWE